MTALSYHAYRLQTNLHAEFDGNRQRIAAAELAVATVERTADGIAVIAPSDLMATFRTQPADAWAMLATLTPAQLTIQAIDTACYLLDVEGRDISWSSVLETWTKRLALIAEAKAEVEEVQGDCEMITRVDTDALNDTAFQVWHTAYANADDARIAAVTRYVTAQAEPFPGDDEAERDAATVRLLQGEIQYPHIVAAAKMALARAIANQTTRIVRRFVNTVTLDDGSVWDDAGRLLIGPYTPPRDVADAFAHAKEQAKETNQPVSLSFIYRA